MSIIFIGWMSHDEYNQMNTRHEVKREIKMLERAYVYVDTSLRLEIEERIAYLTMIKNKYPSNSIWYRLLAYFA